jgi:hypothetical protein
LLQEWKELRSMLRKQLESYIWPDELGWWYLCHKTSKKCTWLGQSFLSCSFWVWVLDSLSWRKAQQFMCIRYIVTWIHLSLFLYIAQRRYLHLNAIITSAQNHLET